MAVDVAVREQADEVHRAAATPRGRRSALQAGPSKMAPDAMASLTSLAPCAKTRPAPRALWPTSELPMSSSLGRPTAVPWALSVVKSGSANSSSSTGRVGQVDAVGFVVLADADAVHDDEDDGAGERTVAGRAARGSVGSPPQFTPRGRRSNRESGRFLTLRRPNGAQCQKPSRPVRLRRPKGRNVRNRPDPVGQRLSQAP